MFLGVFCPSVTLFKTVPLNIPSVWVSDQQQLAKTDAELAHFTWTACPVASLPSFLGILPLWPLPAGNGRMAHNKQ